ncbi:hypothetical protein I2484_05985 [Sporosarcina sp. E16_8]|nr:hypothetical protein [Sporosarcina sp. E16_8]
MGAVSLFFISIQLLFSGACGNEVLSTIDSPNGRYTAYTFTRDCGATTSVSYQLSILKKDQEHKNKSGNTFVSKQEFDVEWADDTQLNIAYPESEKTYKMDNKVGRVDIVYTSR